MAGSLKRENPDKQEDVVLIRALRDSNIPKFLADDAELFRVIIFTLYEASFFFSFPPVNSQKYFSAKWKKSGIVLLQGILGDLFPGVIIPEEDYGVFQQTTIRVLNIIQTGEAISIFASL